MANSGDIPNNITMGAGTVLRRNAGDSAFEAVVPSGTGTVTDVSVTTANGVSGSVATSTTTPAISLTLGAITPTSVNGVVLSGASTPTLAVTGTSSISGANTGDNTVATALTGTPSITVASVTTTGNIELGHASDTTIARSAAGLVTIEGKTILTNTSTAGVGATPTATGTVTITHNLGRTPTMIRIFSKSGFTSNAAATPTTSSEGIWNSSGNFCIYQGINGTTTIAAATSNTFAIYMITSAGNLISGVVQNVGATTFDIAFTETGTHTLGVYMWEAQ